MKLRDVEDDLPILLVHYDAVIQRLETAVNPRRRKVPRKAALDHFLQTRSFTKTARHFGVSPAAINQIVYTAYRIARELAGLRFMTDDSYDDSERYRKYLDQGVDPDHCADADDATNFLRLYGYNPADREHLEMAVGFVGELRKRLVERVGRLRR